MESVDPSILLPKLVLDHRIQDRLKWFFEVHLLLCFLDPVDLLRSSLRVQSKPILILFLPCIKVNFCSLRR